MSKKDVQPWERQDGETPKQFEAFKIYRDMGEERSLSKVAQQLSKTKQLLSRWSSMNGWVDRCAAWDNEQDRLLRIQQLKDIKKMRKKHADVAVVMINAAVKGLNKIMKSKDEELDIKPQDIAKLVDVASKLERISRGDVGDVIEERQSEALADPVQFYMPDNGRGDNGDNEE